MNYVKRRNKTVTIQHYIEFKYKQTHKSTLENPKLIQIKPKDLITTSQSIHCISIINNQQ